MATYYVDTAVGNDANAGTSEGAGNAWATIDKAMNTVTGNDKVWVKASGTYNETATLDTAGAAASIIEFEGYTSTTGDNGKVTIDAQSTRSACLNDTLTGQMWYVFKNFIFKNSTADGVAFGAEDAVAFWNCDFQNNSGDGIESGSQCTFVNCTFTGNGARGANTAGSNGHFVGCIASGNTNGGLIGFGDTVVYKCVVFNNGLTATEFGIRGEYIIGCTVDGENAATGTGIEVGNQIVPVCVDNIVYDCNIAVDTLSTEWHVSVYGYNLLNSNTTDYSNDPHGLMGYQDVSSAPAFTDEAGDDYTLGASSPAIDAGVQPGGIT